MIRVHVVRPGELASAELARWSQLQAADPRLASPYFSPGFTLAVGRARPDARVAVIEGASRIAGFFPFQKRPFGLGIPLGGPLSDYQGIIGNRDVTIDAPALLRGCGLAGFAFTNLIAADDAFKPHHRRVDPSHQIDVSAGVDAFMAERRAAGSDVIPATLRKRRKIEREVGPLRWVLKDPDPASLERVIAWKRDQYRRTRAVDGFAYRWPATLLADLHRIDEPEFGGVLSTLWAGDRMIAGHMGMRSQSVWHYWYPVYDPAFGKYSPGQIMLLAMVESCADLGANVIDLGKGAYIHKLRLGNRAVDVAEGYAGLASLATAMQRLCVRFERTVRRLPLGPAAEWPGKALRRLEGHLGYL